MKQCTNNAKINMGSNWQHAKQKRWKVEEDTAPPAAFVSFSVPETWRISVVAAGVRVQGA